MDKRKFQCSDCDNTWELAYGTPRPTECPNCRSRNIHRSDDNKGYRKGGRRRQERGGFGKNATLKTYVYKNKN